MAFSSEELSRLASNLIEEAERRGTKLRLLGGLGFYLSSPEIAANPALQREYKDLDFAVEKKGANSITDVFISQGWEPERYFNALHGKTRLLFHYQDTLQADIFIGEFEQCHKLDFGERFKQSRVTLPLADLLLTKLQVRQMNEKDAKDIYTMLLGHDFGHGPSQETIDLDYLTNLTSNDWGWYTTVHDNLEKLETIIPKDLSAEQRHTIQDRLKTLREAMEQAPKSLRWQMRNQIGRRVPWYDEPEEVIR